MTGNQRMYSEVLGELSPGALKWKSIWDCGEGIWVWVRGWTWQVGFSFIGCDAEGVLVRNRGFEIRQFR